MNLDAARNPKRRLSSSRAAALLPVQLILFVILTSPPAIPARRPAEAAARPPSVVVDAVDAIGITVEDADAEIEFFSKVLSFEKISDVEVAGEEYERLQGVFGVRMRVVRMRLGDEFIELIEYLAPRGRPIPADSRSNDRWFQHVAIITSDMDRAYQVLRQNKVQHASPGPQTLPAWNKNAGGIKAFYFKDPEGHVLEVLQFPEGKGNPKWHVPSDRLFLGIDHTAVVIADTDESLRFYRDTLGMRVAGESENYGVEQERLNNVFGARLRISALRAGRGPGIELLEYLSPRDGRPYPQEAKTNDLYSWQTRLAVREADRAAQTLRGQKYHFVSSGVISLAASEHEAAKSFLVRDPDGHVMQLIEK